jgi:uncharacterized protein (TIGR00297 family)
MRTDPIFSFDMKHLVMFALLSVGRPAVKLGEFAAISVAFAVLGSVVRGVTGGGAAAGALVCFALLLGGGSAAFAALFVVFLLTWIATRIGYGRKQHLGTAEERAGRNALQVLANLGVAAGCSLLYTRFPNPWVFAAIAGALAEPAADTVSSEIGQALGGVPRLITTWQKVAHGTNGAITWVGTLAGAVAATLVAVVFAALAGLGWPSLVPIVVAATAGMIVDSWLGATLETREILGNNAVNLCSTILGAILAALLIR